MLGRILEYLTAFVHLLYPRLCLVCGEPLITGERHVCSGCLLAIPYNYLGGGKLERKLNRVFPVEGVYALFLYHHGSPYRKIIHALKYHSRKEVGLWLGHMLAVKLLKDLELDVLLPVPLHPKREASRGYNQSVLIAEGIQEVLGVEIVKTVLRRRVNNPSQTKVEFGERACNVENIFQLIERDSLVGKHVLLVDDVITTGSTISACLRELSMIPGIRISVACIGRAIAN